MNQTWEVVLGAMSQGIDPHKIHFAPDMHGSPYRETAFEHWNQSELDSTGSITVGINPLYRFSSLFGLLFDINEREYPELRELCFDVFMHYQSQLDLRQGLTKKEYHLRAILKDILSGAYGAKASETIMLFTNQEAKALLHGMFSLFKCGISIELFNQTIRAVYPNARVYRNNNVYRELLVYVPIDKHETEVQKLDLIISMFLSINYTVYIFWGHHFGIIDVDETLEFDEMLLF